MIDFCFDFFSILAPFWGPSWSHVGHLFRAKTPQDASRTATGRPKTPPGRPQDAPRRPQDTPRRPKTPPRRPQGAQNPPQTTILEGFGPSGPRFWTLQTSIFGRFWEDFWKTFGLTLFRTPWAILLLCYFSFVLARWRVRSFAALLDKKGKK